MSGAILRRYPGAIYYTVQGLTEGSSAVRLMASWNAELLNRPTDVRAMADGISVDSVVTTGQAKNLPAVLYGLLWRLSAAIEASGAITDEDW